MNPTPVIDMFSGTGELARAVADGLQEPARPISFSDNYGPARAYLHKRFLGAQTTRDFHDQIVPEGSIVTIGAPCRDLSVAGKRAGAWEVGAPHRRERIMLVAARRRFEPRRIEVIRQVAPPGLLPTPTASSATGPGRSGRGGGANLQTRIHKGPDPDPALIITWARAIGEMHSPLKDDEDRLNASFVEWLMGLPTDNAANLSRTARIRLAGNAVVGLQVRLMLQRGLTAVNDTRGTL